MSQKAREYAIVTTQMMKGRVGTITPHLNTVHFPYSRGCDYNFWINFYLRVLERVADIMIVIPGWQNSFGVKKEIALAEEKGIPIIYPENKCDLVDLLRSFFNEG